MGEDSSWICKKQKQKQKQKPKTKKPGCKEHLGSQFYRLSDWNMQILYQRCRLALWDVKERWKES